MNVGRWVDENLSREGNMDGGLLFYFVYLWMDVVVVFSGVVVEDSYWQCMR